MKVVIIGVLVSGISYLSLLVSDKGTGADSFV